ncbi:prophage antirepressor-like protein [Mycetocola sp. BIGb0189]|uniref:phage antirepressor n=1 Tax=Mycetocola sp. BIGb0189 TaxID=2940604 RepID=UPI002169B25B|nr:phage antirepressor [Mycetocola sp. BIGb0189]MCS4277913.1 prophage antirepressor-like protein [Mycetocola sp. BIGb0189]
MQILPFDYGTFQVRVVEHDGEPWFVLADLCAVLGLTTPARVADRLDQAGVSQAHISSGGQQRLVTIVSEPGMYEVVIRSDKAEAVAFRRWITAEVLPTIRKTGSYGATAALPATYADALRELAATVEQTAALEAKIQIDSPKVSYVDQFVADEDLLLLRTVAKTIGVPEGELREALIARGWIYEETSTRWSEKQQDLVKMVRYSAYSQKRAYFRPVLRHDAPRFKGEVMHTLKVTPQGAEAIARNFKKEDAA